MTREGSAPLAETAQQVQGVAREPGHEMARPDNGAIGQTQAWVEQCEILPCPNPWCEAAERGPDFVPVIRLHHFGDYRVVCTSCVTEGPLRQTKAEAIAAWNTRHQSRTDTLREAAKVRQAVFGGLLSFAKDPASTDYQRGYKAALENLASLIPATDEKPTTGVEGGDAPMEMTAEERRLEDLKQQAAYVGPIVSFDVREPYYLASCDHCGWVGSSELCGTDTWGDDSDVYCPRCHASGADYGKIAERIDSTPTMTLPEASEVERLWELLGTRSRPDLDPNLTAAVFRWARKSGNFPGYRSQDGRIAAEAFNALPHLLASLRPTSQEAEGREAQS
jgi:hypothetical protein